MAITRGFGWSFVVSALLANACGSPGDEPMLLDATTNGAVGMDGAGSSSAPDSGVQLDSATATSTFADVQSMLDSMQCASCHDFFPIRYESLVNAPAQRGPCSGEMRVIPGNLEESLLWRKLAPGVDVCGKKMPDQLPLFGLPPAAGQLEVLRSWIEGGAVR
jgi:hypothetical protein